MSLLIKGGRIVTSSDTYVADIYIERETISVIGSDLTMPADKIIDARGKLVLPGGIDPHTHIQNRTRAGAPGTMTRDDFTSATVAAAFGGYTTIIDFPIQWPGETIEGTLETWHEKIDRCKPVIDVGFHLAVTDLSVQGVLAELRGAVDNGITSFKLLMAYKDYLMASDETLFRVMQLAAESGALVMVHAENGTVVDLLVDKAVADGRTEPIWHARTRPPETESEATYRAIQFAHIASCPLYVVHVSCRDAAERIGEARSRGWDVWGETCARYLVFDESDLERPDFEGAKYVYSTPPRPRSDVDFLWTALRRDILSVVSSDHGAYDWSLKLLGKGDFSQIPPGSAGIEHTRHVVHHFGVNAGLLTLHQFVDLTSTRVAKIFGLYPRKGSIVVGSDADLVLWDAQKPLTLSTSSHHMTVDFNIYEGISVIGAPDTVVARGKPVIENDVFVGKAGAGRFLKRQTYTRW